MYPYYDHFQPYIMWHVPLSWNVRGLQFWESLILHSTLVLTYFSKLYFHTFTVTLCGSGMLRPIVYRANHLRWSPNAWTGHSTRYWVHSSTLPPSTQSAMLDRNHPPDDHSTLLEPMYKPVHWCAYVKIVPSTVHVVYCMCGTQIQEY